MSGNLSVALEQATLKCRDMDAPLHDRLQALADDVRRLSREFAEIVDRMVARLQAAGAGASSPQIGETMPTFLLSNQQGNLVALERYLAKSAVVLSFHRGHWCPYCRISANALARAEPEIRGRGGQVVVITPETEQFTLELEADAGAQFPILSDMDSAYALELGLAILINEEKRTAMTAAGWDIAPFNANSNWVLPIPATFVIGRDGLVKGRFVDPDYRKRMAVEDILSALDAAQA